MNERYTPEQIEQELKITLRNGRYNARTTFYSDFSIANRFGADAITDTFERAFREWKDDIIYLTELSMVTNHFSWEHSDNEELCGIYCELYFRCRDYAYGDNFPEHEVFYYYRCTD